jgi:hypothetical protein
VALENRQFVSQLVVEEGLVVQVAFVLLNLLRLVFDLL